MNENEPLEFPKLTELDLEILKYREAHFSGSFPLMIEYYQTEKAGQDPEFSIERMQALELVEKSLGQNLSALMLTDEQKEEIENSKALYKKLKGLYAKKGKESPLQILIADLILSEECDPQKEIESLIACGKKAVPSLIALMQNEDLHNPLFPGFGNAPSLAIECLRGIKDDSAIIALFEEIGHEEVVDEEGALLALRAIGPAAQEFLLRVASSQPITYDNERAAIALIHFKDVGKVAEEALNLLEKEPFRSSIPLSSYLALVASEVKEQPLKERFMLIAKDPTTPKALKNEIDLMIRTWKLGFEQFLDENA